MIVTKLKGGLGNQMFQYALGKNLSLQNNTSLKLDINWYKSGKNNRDYKLNKFNITEDLINKSELKKFYKHRPHFSKLGKIYDLFFVNSSKYVKEKTRDFEPDIFLLKDNTYLDGNWQSEKYFKNIEDIIRKEFTLKNKPSANFEDLLTKIKEVGENSIAVHIRHGDYSLDPEENKRHTALPLGYYLDAIKTIKGKIPNPAFFFFSDDIKWCKNQFGNLQNVYFVGSENLIDYESLILMSKCSHQIIANSSFSWWSAWLNENPNKIIIAPAQWYNRLRINIDDRIPKGWTKRF